jgi:predicted nucleic acid-binding protein
VIVVDASVAVLALLNDGDARRSLASEFLAIPHLADSEDAHALEALRRWAQLGVRRFSVVGLLGRVWSLRDTLSAYEASYVALAEAMACPLHPGGATLAGAAGPRCPIVVVRR